METNDDGSDQAAASMAAAAAADGCDEDDDKDDGSTEDGGGGGSVYHAEYDDYLTELLSQLSRGERNQRFVEPQEPFAIKRVSLQVESVPYGGIRYAGISRADDDDNNGYGDEETETAARKPKIPDGGWGWMVVFASLMICLISDGISFSFGLLYIEFLKEFQESKSKTAWIGSLFMAVPLILGPVGSALVDKFGCRKMTIVGGIVSGLGFIISSFADSIEMVFFTFGFLSGLGLCLCYVTAVVSIAYWFDKKRTLATGLGACGTGIGTLLYAPMTQYSIEEYGWRGTVLLLAGTFFNFCVCGALMRDPDWLIAEQKKPPAVDVTATGAGSRGPWPDTEESIVDCCPAVAVENETTPNRGRAGSVGRSDDDVAAEAAFDAYPGVDQYRRMVKEAQGAEYRLTGVTTTVRQPSAAVAAAAAVRSNGGGGNGFRSVINLPTYVRHNERVSIRRVLHKFVVFLEKIVFPETSVSPLSEFRNQPSFLGSRSKGVFSR